MSIEYYFIVFITAVLAFLAENMPQKNRSVSGIANAEIAYLPNKKIVFLLAAILIFFAGFRFRVGTDYGGYFFSFYEGWEGFWENLISFKEPGILLISAIGRSIYDNGISTIFLSALITIGLFVITIYRYSPIFFVSILLYILMGEWTGCFNGIRQYLAAAVLFYGHHYILEKQFKKYVYIVFIAFLFHTTALVMIVPYFLLRRKITVNQIVLLLIGCIIIRYSYSTVFSAVSAYKGHELNTTTYTYVTNSVNILRILVACVPMAVYALFCRKRKISIVENFYINAMFFHGFSMIATGGSTYLARMGIYSGPMTAIGYCYLLKMVENKITRNFITFCMIVLFFIYFWIETSFSGSLRNFNWWFGSGY